MRSLLATHLVDVVSSDQHTVKPWFDGKIDFAPEVRDLSANGFPLVGGRLDYLDGKTVVALVYQRNKHPINLFITPEPTSRSTSPKVMNRRGYNVFSWTKQRNELVGGLGLKPSRTKRIYGIGSNGKVVSAGPSAWGFDSFLR